MARAMRLDGSRCGTIVRRSGTLRSMPIRPPSPTTGFAPRTRRIAGWAALGWAAAMAWLTRLPTPPDPGPNFPGKDKLIHATLYAVLGALTAVAISGRLRRPWPLVIATAAVALAYGCIDEIHQSFVPGRVADIADVAADLVGGLVGGGLIARGMVQRSASGGDR